MNTTWVRHTIWLALLFGATTAVGQPSAPTAPNNVAPAVENVIVNGASSKAINHFVQAAVTPTHTIGKVARWEGPICLYALGLPDDVNALVVKRVKALADEVGVRVSSDAACKPNIVIAFTSTPQALLDSIRKDHTELLGYHTGPDDLAKLATVTRPIQAWYSTATVDLLGHREIDSSRTDTPGSGLVLDLPCYLTTSARSPTPTSLGVINMSNPLQLCTRTLPYATKANVEGSRLVDGLRATLDHVTIVADTTAVHESRATIDDYIAMLALAQINGLDKCQDLPSIANLLASGCHQTAKEITANDLGYLKAVYEANPAQLPGLQESEIAHRMEQGIAGQ